MTNITRSNITWDLCTGIPHDEYLLNVYWTEPSRRDTGRGQESHMLVLVQQGKPWAPWQINGVVTALKAGREPNDALVPRAAPVVPSRVALEHRVGGAILTVADRLTRRRSMVGAR